MLSYYLKCRKKKRVKTQGLQRQIKENKYFYQNLQRVEVKKQDLLKSKKLIDY